MSGTILLVDDEAPVARSLARALRPTGHRVLIAGGGAEALEILHRESVDVMISDVQMPNMSGLALLARVRDQYPDMVRIFLTAGSAFDTALRAINECGVYRYITKPWDDAELRSIVEQAMALRESLRRFQEAEDLVRRKGRTLPTGAAPPSGSVHQLDGARFDALLEKISPEVLAALASD